ncbi:hypothetical protein HRbin37_01934 [bacterium HR37]|nr:hypothetical protein HRbin37_01934 [bacterium HR37]
MAVRNPEILKEVLGNPRCLARAFSRHVYGMVTWVDVFGGKLKSIKDLDAKLIAARVIADNAKHAKLFSDRARELGDNPQGYRPTQIGERIYEFLESYEDTIDCFAYALGSLNHFMSLLNLYYDVADAKSKRIIEEIRKDVEEHIGLLERYIKAHASTPERIKRAEELRLLAESIYTEREDEEIKWYVS